MTQLLDEDLLALLDDAEATEQVWDMLSESTDERLDQLTQARERKDREEVRRLAHALKGSALQCGAPDLGRFCATVEASAFEMDDDQLLQAIQTARELWVATREAFHKRPG